MSGELTTIDARVATFFSVELDQLEFAIAPHAAITGMPEYGSAKDFMRALCAEAKRRGYQTISYHSMSGMGDHVKFVKPKI